MTTKKKQVEPPKKEVPNFHTILFVHENQVEAGADEICEEVQAFSSMGAVDDSGDGISEKIEEPTIIAEYKLVKIHRVNKGVQIVETEEQ